MLVVLVVLDVVLPMDEVMLKVVSVWVVDVVLDVVI